MEVSVDLVLTYFLKYFTYHTGAINKYVSLVNCPFVCQQIREKFFVYHDVQRLCCERNTVSLAVASLRHCAPD